MFLAYYLITRYPPFDLQKIQQLIELKQIEENDIDRLNAEIEAIKEGGLLINYLSPIVFAAFSLLISGIAGAIIATHLAIDKLFFKKFYEQPKMTTAVRRGLLIAVLVGAIIVLNIFAYQQAYVLMVILVAIIIEAGFLISARVNRDV